VVIEHQALEAYKMPPTISSEHSKTISTSPAMNRASQAGIGLGRVGTVKATPTLKRNKYVSCRDKVLNKARRLMLYRKILRDKIHGVSQGDIR
jgi:hypothetical protein